MFRAFLLLPFLTACAGINPTLGVADASQKLPLQLLSVPSGAKVSVYARVPNARQMVLSPNGTLFVGNRDGGGGVWAVVDKDKDGVGEQVIQIGKNMRSPNGVEFKDGSLYVGEISRILRYDNIESQLDAIAAGGPLPKPVVVTDKYPTDDHHGWKYIRFGPDGWLYVPVGAPCNVCDKGDPFASITRIKPDGSGREIFARGIRNTVGFDWDPKTKELWFTDNGRDMMGDNKPFDELNHAPKAGMHFGFPYCHANGISDPEFGKGKDCANYTSSAMDLGPHVAALGMKFYSGTMFPGLAGDIIYAEHGSWNRTEKSGYRVMHVKMKDGKPVENTPLVEGFLAKAGGQVWGRPVDIVVMPDGSILFSDDYGGVIYRIAREPGSAGFQPAPKSGSAGFQPASEPTKP
jgi:glucose/arabinose dehydrogenase